MGAALGFQIMDGRRSGDRAGAGLVGVRTIAQGAVDEIFRDTSSFWVSVGPPSLAGGSAVTFQSGSEVNTITPV